MTAPKHSPATAEPASMLPSGKERRRQRILATARELIAKHGVNHLRVRELAELSGVATATLYNQFGGKDGIVAQALKQEFEERFSLLSSGNLDQAPADLLRELMATSARDAKATRENAEATMLYYFGGEENSELRSFTHDTAKQVYFVILQEIERRDGLESWVDKSAIADDMVSSTFAVLLKWVQGYLPDRDLEARLLQIVALPLIAVSRGESRRSFEKLVQKRPRGSRRR